VFSLQFRLRFWNSLSQNPGAVIMTSVTLALAVCLAAASLPAASAHRAGPSPAGQKKADPAATKLLTEARAARAAWQNFPGFTADIEVNIDGKVHRGKVDVKANGKVKVEFADDSVSDWVQREMASLVTHRLASGSDNETPCVFVDGAADHPMGKAVAMLNDDMHSSFRIKDRQILEVNRNMKDMRFTISILENTLNQEKQYLPVNFVVNTWDTKTKQLRSSVTYHHTWQRIGAFDLPATTTVVTAAAGKLECKSLKVTNYKLP
jgi:hypothetical protein